MNQLQGVIAELSCSALREPKKMLAATRKAKLAQIRDRQNIPQTTQPNRSPEGRVVSLGLLLFNGRQREFIEIEIRNARCAVPRIR